MKIIKNNHSKFDKESIEFKCTCPNCQSILEINAKTLEDDSIVWKFCTAVIGITDTISIIKFIVIIPLIAPNTNPSVLSSAAISLVEYKDLMILLITNSIILKIINKRITARITTT